MPGKARNRSLAAIALASGRTIKEAGTAAGVSERAVQNWLTEDAFKTSIRVLRAQMISAAASRLAGEMSKAASVLAALLDSSDEDVRRHAAVKIIELGLKTTELEELQKQVAELERRLDGIAGQQ